MNKSFYHVLESENIAENLYRGNDCIDDVKALLSVQEIDQLIFLSKKSWFTWFTEGTLLHFACIGGCFEVVKFLLSQGASQNLKFSSTIPGAEVGSSSRNKENGKIPKELAVLQGHDKIVTLFEEKLKKEEKTPINKEIRQSNRDRKLKASTQNKNVENLQMNEMKEEIDKYQESNMKQEVEETSIKNAISEINKKVEKGNPKQQIEISELKEIILNQNQEILELKELNSKQNDQISKQNDQISKLNDHISEFSESF